MEIVRFSNAEEKVIVLRDMPVLLDSDVAELYGVETKRINEAVKNNPEKFPNGYIFELHKEEWSILKSKISTSSWGGKNKLPKAFTEKGLYMLATILKGDRAVETTIEIIETFAKFRELQRNVAELSEKPEEVKQKSLMQRSGEILSDLLGNNLKATEAETSFELDFSVLKFRHSVKRKNS